jgi:hypothetical protein
MGTNCDENAAAPQLSKEPADMTESNGEPWRSRITLRLNPPEVLYLRLPRYNAFVKGSWKHARNKLPLRPVLLSAQIQVKRKPILRYQLKERTSPRIVTSKQYRKHTWMRSIVLSIFIHKLPISTLSSPLHRQIPSRTPLHEGL